MWPTRLVWLFFLAGLMDFNFGEVPYPKCAQCPNPYDYSAYLFLTPGVLPNDFDQTPTSDRWKYDPNTGLNVTGAWTVTTGRPDVISAILDSGIIWDYEDVAAKVALNTGELPLPTGCSSYDCNNDGVVNILDYPNVPDANGNGFVDGQDLIRAFSDGIDDDGNGYVDDIAGWDFLQDDNDPADDLRYGHGTGQAAEQLAEANNGGGFPGIAPNVMFIPVRVSDTFIGVDTDFAQGVVYAVDRKASFISEALGTVTASSTSQAAIDFAYRNGIPLVASAADEQARHHNYPASYDHTIWVNSIRNGDGTLVEETGDYTILNGCTNFGGHAWVTIPSTACSSEATARAGGLVGLLISHGKNLVDRGELTPYPGLDTAFSAEEVRQILRWAADDINHAGHLDLSMDLYVQLFFSIFPFGPFFNSSHFPTQAGWDQYTGYGRPDAARMVSITEAQIPPEADLSGGLKWFATVDPTKTTSVSITGSAAAVRAPGNFTYQVQVGCGCQPSSFSQIGSGSSDQPLRQVTLADWNPAATASQCGFDPAAPVEDPDDHTVTIRLQVTDSRGNVGEDRRTLALHADPDLHFAPLSLEGSGEASPVLADINRDGVLDIIYATSDGATHVIRGATGRELLGFPAWTGAIPVHPSRSYTLGRVPVPREPILASPAADDLDGDGRVEIVVASTEGRVYVFDDHGLLRPGFPVSTNPVFSDPTIRDPYNDPDPGILGAPTLANLDKTDQEPNLEIVVAGLDGHIYAWRANGQPVAGFPVRLADPAKVDIGPQDRTIPKDPENTYPMAAKIVGSPAVGDLDGDGYNEIVVGTNEQYAGEADRVAFTGEITKLVSRLGAVGIEDIRVDVNSRLYVVQHDGMLNPGGPFRPGWPVPVAILIPSFLPLVGNGTPGSPALADIDGSGTLKVAIFSAVGPVELLDADGKPVLGPSAGAMKTFATEFPGSSVPITTGSFDAPFVALLGSGVFGDITGDGLPEYAAPTIGTRNIIDYLAPGSQEFSDVQVTAWNPRSGALLPAFPRVVDDLSFLSNPALVDVDGDGKADVISGTGSYLLRAYRENGQQPSNWPKFTHGWILASPAAGDVDGDGLTEIVVTTREGNLYVWDTPAAASLPAIPWQGAGRDRRHTQNLNSGVSPLAPERQAEDRLIWLREAVGARTRLQGRTPR